MPITSIKPEINNGAKSVSVTFTNEEGKVYVRSINVPYKDGVVNQELFDEWLNSHLMAVEHKANVGVIQFVDPSANTDNNGESENGTNE